MKVLALIFTVGLLACQARHNSSLSTELTSSQKTAIFLAKMGCQSTCPPTQKCHCGCTLPEQETLPPCCCGYPFECDCNKQPEYDLPPPIDSASASTRGQYIWEGPKHARIPTMVMCTMFHSFAHDPNARCDDMLPVKNFIKYQVLPLSAMSFHLPADQYTLPEGMVIDDGIMEKACQTGYALHLLGGPCEATCLEKELGDEDLENYNKFELATKGGCIYGCGNLEQRKKTVVSVKDQMKKAKEDVGKF